MKGKICIYDTYTNSEIFANFSFANSVKDILVTIKFATWTCFTYINKRRGDFASSREFSLYKVGGFFCLIKELNRGSYMSAHVLLDLLNELGKRDKMRGLPSILSLFRNELNKFNNT